MPPLPIEGFTVAITGDRRADEQAELLRRRGASVLHGPTIRTRSLTEDPALRNATRATIDHPPTIVVATTGVGIRSWMEASDSIGMGDDLRATIARAEVVARSPKAAGALLTAGLPCHWSSAQETNAGLLAHLARRDLGGVRIAVQRDGGETASVADRLTEMGGDVVDVPVYRWALPRDLAPAHRLLDALADHQLDAVTITSSPALENLLELADRRPDAAQVRRALVDEVLVACVGPVCAARARAVGAHRIVQPSRFRLGAMIRVLTEALGRTAWSLPVDGTHLAVQGGLARVDGEAVTLPRREQLVLRRLAAAGGAVVSKTELARTGWSPGTDPHVVEVTIGRLRRRLGDAGGALVTVPRRGYRLVAAPMPGTTSPGSPEEEGAATEAARTSAGRGRASQE